MTSAKKIHPSVTPDPWGRKSFQHATKTIGIFGLGEDGLDSSRIMRFADGKLTEGQMLPMKKVEKPRVVAIGASAGGLDAFRKLIENLPVDTGMAFVLLTHILRGSTSLLPEILARSTKMPVLQVTDGMRLLANQICVIPPDKLMEIREGSLHLVPRPLKGANNAIDHFLFSLAEDHVYGSIGIILSGEGSDGAEGIKILKEEGGGVTMAQEPASAASKSMPINAIQIDHVDHILSPEDIAHKLASMSWRDSNIKKTPLKVLWMRKPMPV